MRNRVVTFVYAERPAFTAGATAIACLVFLALVQALGI
jgi:hypothetical protein